MTELVAGVEAATADEQQRVLILRGAGKAFCAGMDLNEVANRRRPTRPRNGGEILLALSQTRLITIAAVHGAAVAGGAV